MLVSYRNKEREWKRVQKRFGRTIYRYGKPRRTYNPFYANDNSAFIPEMWAEESVRLLYEQMVFGGTVHRDFSPEVAEFGDTVNTRKPNAFSGRRKQNDLDNVTTQDATSTNIQVKLDQRVYVSFVIGDGERSKSFKDLFNYYLEPAMQAEAQFLDRCLAMQAYQFLGNTAGGLGTLTSTNAHEYLLDAREVMNKNKATQMNRWMALASRSETEMQKTEIFKRADAVGDFGEALTNAILGRKAGWNTFLELNTPSVRNATVSGSSTLASAASAGDTSITLATGGVAASGAVAGCYVTVAGDMTPLRVTNISSETLTLNRPLRENVANGAAVTVYDTALVNQPNAIGAGDNTAAVTNGYPANWAKGIAYDGAATPNVGQLVSFVSSGGTVYSAEYGIVDVSGGEIWLDRPLEDTIDDNAVICLGPSGDYNFGYQREALTLLNRPLALPPEGTGARSAAAVFNNMAIRVVLTYDGEKQGTRVTIDSLFGMKVLDTDRGVVLLG